MNQMNNNDSDKLRSDVKDSDISLEKITRSILRLIKDADASSAGGVRTDYIRKTITDELKKDKSK
jgi:hypothetical protein